MTGALAAPVRSFEPDLPLPTECSTTALPGQPPLVHGTNQQVLVHKRRAPAEFAVEAASEVRKNKLAAAEQPLPHEAPQRQNPAGWSSPPLKVSAKRRGAGDAMHQFRSAPEADHTLPPLTTTRASAVMQATETSVLKINPGMPNKSDPHSGWGPIEHLTVAALDFSSHPRRVPQEYEAFTELALWLARNFDAAKGAQLANEGQEEGALLDQSDPRDGGGVTQDDVEHFSQLSKKLLGLNRNPISALLQESAEPGANTVLHNAKLLWRGIPQPHNFPADRESAESLSYALDMALAEIEAPHRVQPVPELPDGSARDANRYFTAISAWNARRDIASEVAVWTKMEQELTRQVHVRCHELGRLTARTLERRTELMGDVLAATQALTERITRSQAGTGELKAALARAEEDKRVLQKRLRDTASKEELLREEVRTLEDKHKEMMQKYRRGRWDVIETQVSNAKLMMQKEMENWMEQVRSDMQAEYEVRVQEAVKEALEGKSMGAKSGGQQPEMA